MSTTMITNDNYISSLEFPSFIRLILRLLRIRVGPMVQCSSAYLLYKFSKRFSSRADRILTVSRFAGYTDLLLAYAICICCVLHIHKFDSSHYGEYLPIGSNLYTYTNIHVTY